MRIILLLLFFLTFYNSSRSQERYQEDNFEVEKSTYTYASKAGEDLDLDVYSPVNDTAVSKPLIIFMHGGGFSGGSRTSEGEVKFAEAAARKGYVAVQISYRLTRQGKSFGCDYDAEGKVQTFQMAAEDFMDAVNFLVQEKEQFNIDPQQIIAGGSSAGAEAVLNAVYNERLMFRDLSSYYNFKFAGVFSLAGAVVDARYITEENAVPGIFFHGTEDNLVPYATGPHHWCERENPGYIILDGSRTITERLKGLDTSYMLYSFEGGKHEHSGMPVEYFPEIFRFFKEVFLDGEKKQVEVVKE